jgi:hydroxymethylglutaryl-CoA lyase
VQSAISIHEVGPRDGLQNEAERLSLEARFQLVRALVLAGLKRIEVGSFVRPDWIPQLADTDELVRRLIASDQPKLPADLRLYGLVPNRIGLQRAVDCGLKDVAVFMSATESHNQKNTNKSMAESLREFEQLIPAARAQGVQVRAYLSCVWGCPYEGKVDPVKSLGVADQLRALGATELSLGDTIGVGNPKQTQEIVSLYLAGSGAVRGFEASQLALHMHDTHGTALANCLAAYQLGVRIFDASVGGTGGCPYAPGAAGNLATEDLASMFEDMGIESGVSMERLFDAGALAQKHIGHALTGRRLQAELGRREKILLHKAAT